MKDERREKLLDEQAALRAVLIAIVRGQGAVAITRSQIQEAKDNPDLQLDIEALPGNRALVLRVSETSNERKTEPKKRTRGKKADRGNRP